MNICLNCQQETTNLKFCSRSCAATYNNHGIVRNKPKERECSSCGAVFFRTSGNRSVLCESCRERFEPGFYQNKTLAEYHGLLSVKGKHRSWRNSHICVLNRSWNKHLVSCPCQNCGYDKYVELCHVRSISSFPGTATLGEVNAESNNLVLCRNCHWEFDNGLLDL